MGEDGDGHAHFDQIWRPNITINYRGVSILCLRLLHTMNVRFSLFDIAQRILGVTLPNFQ